MSQESDRVAGVIFSEIENLKSSPCDEADALAADLHEAVRLIFSRATAREEERRKTLEWEKIVPQCRTAQERFKKLNADAEKQNVVLAQARVRADDAEAKLNRMREARPSPYPTSAEISDWEKACQNLADLLEAARAKVRTANQRRAELTGEVLRARNEFTALVFRERNLRGKEPQPIYQGIELAGVR